MSEKIYIDDVNGKIKYSGAPSGRVSLKKGGREKGAVYRLIKENIVYEMTPLQTKELEIPDDYINLRKQEYPPIGDQLDAIWKELNYRRMNGGKLIQEADDILNDILSVKKKFPKE